MVKCFLRGENGHVIECNDKSTSQQIDKNHSIPQSKKYSVRKNVIVETIFNFLS